MAMALGKSMRARTMDFSAEELVARMSDDDLFSKQQGRPGTATGSCTSSVPSRPASRNSNSGRRQTVLAQLKSASTARPRSCSSSSSLGHSMSTNGRLLRLNSAPDLKSQRIEHFHLKRQRKWLEGHGKQCCLSFTEQETMDFRRFFNALAMGGDTLRLDRFEDMLVCLDLARTRGDIRGFTSVLEDYVEELNFEDFLKAFENNLSSTTMNVLKLLLQGKYDPRDLEYPTFISERRRELIFSATGARGEKSQAPTASIVRTFADIFEDRCYDFNHTGTNRTEDGLNLMGELRRMWQVACLQHGLARTLTAEERAKNVGQRPSSPRTVINSIVKAPVPKALGVHRIGGTVVIEADGIIAPR